AQVVSYGEPIAALLPPPRLVPMPGQGTALRGLTPFARGLFARIPDLHPLSERRGQPLAVAAPGHIGGTFRVPGEGQEDAARGHVPDLHGPAWVGRGQAPAVGAAEGEPGDGRHGGTVGLVVRRGQPVLAGPRLAEPGDHFARGDGPEAKRAVPAGA